MQYTLRQVPRHIDAALRKKAKLERKNLNEVALEALARGAGVYQAPPKFNSLDFAIRTWIEDPDFDKLSRTNGGSIRTCGNEVRPRYKPLHAFACGEANDLWIAALVIQHDLVLLSRDRHSIT